MKNCWEYNSEGCKINIDAINGRLWIYSCLNEEKILPNIKYDDVVSKLNLIDGYELYSDELVGEYHYLQYEKMYGEIYNPYQKVLITCKNQIIITITIFDFYYEDKEVLIDKQQAIDIAEENGIKVGSIELVIENTDLNELRDKQFNIDVSENLDNSEMIFHNINVRKVWKILDEDNRICYIDVNTEEIFKYNSLDLIKESN